MSEAKDGRSRKEEIVDACEELYRSKSFRDISIRDISEKTSFTRTSIYNYFSSKEEIFLSLLSREYMKWIDDLKTLAATDGLDLHSFAEGLGASLEKRAIMLKLLSMNFSDMEENTRLQQLTDFKNIFNDSVNVLSACVRKAIPYISEDDLQGFITAIMPMMFGLHPYTSATPKQLKAMELAGCSYRKTTVSDLVIKATVKLLS